MSTDSKKFKKGDFIRVISMNPKDARWGDRHTIIGKKMIYIESSETDPVLRFAEEKDYKEYIGSKTRIIKSFERHSMYFTPGTKIEHYEPTIEVSADFIMKGYRDANDEQQRVIEKAAPELFTHKFKEGDWITHNGNKTIKIIQLSSTRDQNLALGMVCDRFIDQTGDKRSGSSWTFHMYDGGDWELATPAEIKACLIKMCEHQGIQMFNTKSGRIEEGTIYREEWSYDSDKDRLYASRHYGGPIVYSRGEFSETYPARECALTPEEKNHIISQIK